ncbi:ABC-type spermidine/putrescine transport system permease subunit I [Kibdelosporangium banguiense]|uniref:ABC-type spermidine/putrescine transport system permease subunit I n=1 Tax=Kibdelosporangium banguiense TaxID=1365924 RepID=A0ABS4T9H4_9PSEU|nr:hypothetical protein [Kibdelosporangium banguiense]MBP2320486.1 ABC-type spermidine/putrescine transport system permease subunit I [Kibdelosporangium banguiense]
MEFLSVLAIPAVAAVLGVVVCFIVAMPVCLYIAKKRGAEGLRAFSEVIRAFWGKKR